MIYNCVGCGGEFETTGGVLAYGNVSTSNSGAVAKGSTFSRYAKELCPRCQHVLKDMLLRSDLSEQWDEYDWSLEGDNYTEEYND